jgi:hypothetical protein
LLLVCLSSSAALAQDAAPPSEPTPRIAVSFGHEEAWSPSGAAFEGIFGCQPRTFTCVRQIMEQNGASADAVAFYALTGWFLSDVTDTSPVQLGTIFTPWRANENTQYALLGGVPQVLFVEQETPRYEAEDAQEFRALKRAHPNAWLWVPGPKFDGVEATPDGGQRFLFRLRVLDGCHACTILGYIRVGFDFAPDGTYQASHVLSGP